MLYFITVVYSKSITKEIDSMEKHMRPLLISTNQFAALGHTSSLQEQADLAGFAVAYSRRLFWFLHFSYIMQKKLKFIAPSIFSKKRLFGFRVIF